MKKEPIHFVTLKELQEINEVRARRWHDGRINQWSLLEWTGAMCGEAGEAANIAKKIRRLALNLPNKEKGNQLSDLPGLQMELAKEVSDTIIYAFIILSALEVDATEMIRMVFNKKSEEYGFPERI